MELFTNKYGESIRYQNIAYFLFNFIFTFPIWIAFLTSEKGITIQQIGIILSIRYIVSILMELPSGAFADLFGRKTSIILAYIFMGITSFADILGQNFTQFVMIYILMGISNALESGADEALVYDTLKQNGQEESYHEVSLIRGKILQYAIVIATFTGGLFYLIDPRTPFLLEVFVIILSVILLFRVQEPRVDSEKYSFKSYILKFRDGFKDVTQSRYVATFSLFYALVGGITFTFQVYLNQALLVSLGYSTVAMSVLFGVMRLININLIGKFMKSAKWFTFKNTLLFFPLVMGIAYLPGKLATLYIGGGLVAFAMMVSTARTVLLNKYLNENFDSKNRATSISFVNLVLSIVYSLVAFSASQFDSVQTTFTFYGIVTLLIIFPLSLFVISIGKK